LPRAHRARPGGDGAALQGHEPTGRPPPGDRRADRGRARAAPAPAPVGALRRREAARRHRPRARQAARPGVRRRAHFGARRRERPDGGADAAARGHRARRGGDLRHPRPALGGLRRPPRQAGGRPRAVRRAADPRQARARAGARRLVKPSRILPALLPTAALAALALGVAGCQRGAQQAKAAVTPPATPYAAIADGKADVEGGIIQVAARAPGVVSAVYVEEGDTVKKGEVLARQEDDAPRLAVQTAEAALAQAR